MIGILLLPFLLYIGLGVGPFVREFWGILIGIGRVELFLDDWILGWGFD